MSLFFVLAQARPGASDREGGRDILLCYYLPPPMRIADAHLSSLLLPNPTKQTKHTAAHPPPLACPPLRCPATPAFGLDWIGLPGRRVEEVEIHPHSGSFPPAALYW